MKLLTSSLVQKIDGGFFTTNNPSFDCIASYSQSKKYNHTPHVIFYLCNESDRSVVKSCAIGTCPLAIPTALGLTMDHDSFFAWFQTQVLDVYSDSLPQIFSEWYDCHASSFQSHLSYIGQFINYYDLSMVFYFKAAGYSNLTVSQLYDVFKYYTTH